MICDFYDTCTNTDCGMCVEMKLIKLPYGVRRISGREYRALMDILKEKEGDSNWQVRKKVL